MYDFPAVTICILTFQRYEETLRCIEALRQHLQYDAEKLHWMIADDASPDNTASRLRRAKPVKELNVRVLVTDQNGGFGANYNHAMQHIETDLHLFIESDYLLTRSLDLRAGVALMLKNPALGMLRYRATSGSAHPFLLHQHEVDVSEMLPDYREGMGLPGKLTYFLIDQTTPDLYIWSNGCHLKRDAFMKHYGNMPTAGKLGAIEETYAHQVRDRMREPGAPAIAIQPEFIAMAFDHIAPSYQHSEFDVER